ncbi:hypothetical protein LOZ39_004460 [Ophidiomyces ophidiicola]|nr:hypothetical protein LOZ64_004566 [Ophidiomyces ophidiicola]KAI2008738.1 hypothetical protein LOZ50_001959 [Ophidiomyces ophidiicola]KAI2011458.1 hypothetical protein LOZ49_003122 [Ophidiomyces ophidiicola]KAI2016128.1 hypothetical protein LOZ46_005052 [Ophidiomyces ophidiicola]KAI2049781.1 hypothetical protein LOZ44_003706 [Ophidiomyces ophidiicola]
MLPPPSDFIVETTSPFIPPMPSVFARRFCRCPTAQFTAFRRHPTAVSFLRPFSKVTRGAKATTPSTGKVNRAKYESGPDSGRKHRAQSSFFIFAKAFLFTLIPLTPIIIVFREHVISTYPVGGPSMAPYLNATYGVEDLARETVVVNKFFWTKDFEHKSSGGIGNENWKGLRRGMVVMFRSPRNPEILAIKRIIGLPGDEITPRSSPRELNTQPPSSMDFTDLTQPQMIPYNHIWVEGDANDTSKSLDSNTYGPISMNLITGRVVGVVWPWEARRMLRWELWDVDATAENLHEDSNSSYHVESERDSGGATGRSQRMRVKKNVLSVQVPHVS